MVLNKHSDLNMKEARLINTGNFRDLQRNNIKVHVGMWRKVFSWRQSLQMATKMMIENYKMNDIITKASAFAKPNQVGRFRRCCGA